MWSAVYLWGGAAVLGYLVGATGNKARLSRRTGAYFAIAAGLFLGITGFQGAMSTPPTVLPLIKGIGFLVVLVICAAAGREVGARLRRETTPAANNDQPNSRHDIGEVIRPSQSTYGSFLRSRREVNIAVGSLALLLVAVAIGRYLQGEKAFLILLAFVTIAAIVVGGSFLLQALFMRNAGIWVDGGYVFRRTLLGRVRRFPVRDIARVVDDPDTRGPEAIPYVSAISASGDRLLSLDRRMWSQAALDSFWSRVGKAPEDPPRPLARR